MKVSASQVSKLRRCKRAFAFEYVENKRPPSSKVQEFGTAVHKQLEMWLSESKVPDGSAAGLVAKSGLQWLPVPHEKLETELEFVMDWGPNVQTGGFIDVIQPPGLFDTAEPMIIDHKTTSDLRWAKSEADLVIDEQAIIYSVWAMTHFDSAEVRARWVYYAATNPKSGRRRPKGTRMVEVLFSARDPKFLAEVERLDLDVKECVRIRTLNLRGMSFEPSPESCRLFGGCFHVNRCNLSPLDSLGAYIERDIRKNK